MMPEIRVSYKEGVFSKEDMERVESALQQFASHQFSVSDRHLAARDFSVKFERWGVYDYLSHEVVIRVFLPMDAGQQDMRQDSIDKLLNVAIGTLPSNIKRGISVSICYSDIDWAAWPSPNTLH